LGLANPSRINQPQLILKRALLPLDNVTSTKPMPISAPKPCGHAGCGKLVRDGSGRCEAHKSEAWVKKPTATKRVTGRKLQRLRKELFTANPLCVECAKLGFTTLATQRDHIVALTDGGADDESNTQGLCQPCHEAKSLAERLRAQRRSRG
jgi:5-methylcytosine-specific restriction enzyme A